MNSHSIKIICFGFLFCLSALLPPKKRETCRKSGWLLTNGKHGNPWASDSIYIRTIFLVVGKRAQDAHPPDKHIVRCDPQVQVVGRFVALSAVFPQGV